MPLAAGDYSRYVHSVVFRRKLFGYHPDDVDAHLYKVSDWFALSGLDELLDERVRQLRDQAEQRLAEAHEEAAQILADARREAAGMREVAQEHADAVLEDARRQAALERRGRSRVGRPLGGGRAAVSSRQADG
jgi:DivIVA domain-containing protein